MGVQWPFNPDSWVTLQFARDKIPYAHLALGLLVATWLVTFFVAESRWGYGWRAVKDDPAAAQSLGVEVFRSKMAAAAISAFFTAVGGGLYASYVSYIDPESVMSFRFSLLFALPAVLGGVGTLWGALVGAAILIPITEISRSYLGGTGSGIDLIFYGGLVMVVAIARPEGVLSLFKRTRAARNEEV
jgi:branched-chain amino acid transport system permease protein